MKPHLPWRLFAVAGLAFAAGQRALLGRVEAAGTTRSAATLLLLLHHLDDLLEPLDDVLLLLLGLLAGVRLADLGRPC